MDFREKYIKRVDLCVCLHLDAAATIVARATVHISLLLLMMAQVVLRQASIASSRFAIISCGCVHADTALGIRGVNLNLQYRLRCVSLCASPTLCSRESYSCYCTRKRFHGQNNSRLARTIQVYAPPQRSGDKE